jgi:hypothetical protein
MDMRRTFRWAESLYLLHWVKQYRQLLPIRSVADPGCLSQILIFVHPKTATKERGEKNVLFYVFFVATNITKFKFILFLNWRRKKIWANLQRIIEPFYP